MPRMIWFRVDYAVSAQLEAAGLSSPSLQETCPFVVFKNIIEPLVTRPVTATHQDQIRPALGLGAAKPCSVQMQLTSDGFGIATGMIEADVAITLPVSLKIRHAHLVLYEDVDLKVGTMDTAVGKQDPRVVYRQTYNMKHFTSTDDDGSSGKMRTLSGRLEIKISGPDARKYGLPAALLESQLLDIAHRVGVEISFLLGSQVSMSVPVTLIKVVALPA